MAKSFSQLKKEVLGSNYEQKIKETTGYQDNKKFHQMVGSERSGLDPSIQTTGDVAVRKKQLEAKIGFSTFEADLEKTAKTVNSVTTGWHSKDSMKKERSNVQKMQERINAYNEYVSLVNQLEKNKQKTKQTVQTDVTVGLPSLDISFDLVLEDWDIFTNEYGKFQSADAYNKEKNVLARLGGLSSGQVKNEMNASKANAKKLEDTLNAVKVYDDKVKQISNNMINVRSVSDAQRAKDALAVATKERDDYVKNLGFESYDDLKTQYEYAKGGIAYTTADGYNYTWKELYNEAQMREKAEEVATRYNINIEGKYKKENVTYQPAAATSSIWLPSDENKHIYNLVNGDKEAISANSTIDVATSKTNDTTRYKYLNEREKKVFNTLWKNEGEQTALNYLELISPELRKRRVQQERQDAAKSAAEAPIGSSVLGVFQNVGNNALAPVMLATDYIGDKEIDPNSPLYTNSRYVNAQRSAVEGGIDNSVGKFVYRHGMSAADNMLARVISWGAGTGHVSQFLMSSGASRDTILSAKERGLSDAQAVSLGVIAGTAEAVFESKGFEAMFGAKNLNKGGWKYLVNYIKTEVPGELATEVTNDIADFVIAQDLSQLNTDFRKYLSSGMSREQAGNQVFMDTLTRYADVAAGAAFSSGLMGSPGAVATSVQNNQIGKQIKQDGNTQEVFDISSSPEINTAYEAYTKYADKGITADNINNAQLGSMYSSAVSDTIEVMESKKSTPEQKARAMETYSRLTAMMSSEDSTPRTNTEDSAVVTEKPSKITKTGKALTIKGIDKVGDKTYIVTDDGKVNVANVELNERDSEIVDKAQKISEHYGKDIANLFIEQDNGKQDVEEYSNAFGLAVSYAKDNFPMQTILENKGVLTTDQVKRIYQETIVREARARDDKLRQEAEEAGAKLSVKGVFDSTIIDRTNTVTDGSKVRWDSLTTQQRDAIKFAELFSKATGVNVRLVKSNVEKGKHVGKNGSYNPAENLIEIDVYAGRINSESIKDSIIPTLSHEVTHWAKAKANSMYLNLRESVIQALERKTNLSSYDIIANEVARLDEMHPEKKHTTEDAVDELVARACEDMLTNSKTARELLSNLTESEKKSFKAKVKEVFDNLVEWVDKLLSQYKSDSFEAKALREYDAMLKKASKQWDEMLSQAIENNKVVDGKLSKEETTAVENVGLQYDAETESVAPSDEMFSERTWNESEYVQERDVAVRAIQKAIGVSKQDAERYVDNINSIARMIADDKVRLDYEPNADDNASVLKPNSDYKWTVDMSTLCAKRLLFTGTFDAIQKSMPNTAFTSEDMVKLRTMMMERGYEVACGICYVESTRRELGPITQQFIDRYKLSQETGKPITRINSNGKVVDLVKTKEQMDKTKDNSTDRFYADKNYTPTLADLNTTDIDKVKVDHPLVYEAYLNFMNARGQAKPKLLETRAEYKGEILKVFKNKNALKSRNNAGGLRVQSFSDFEVAHLIDMMQIVLDMSRVGLKSQAYTKVPAFADVFGNTGMKINLSLIAKGNGLDENGNLIFDDVEGMPAKEAFRLRKKYSKNVGTILVGKNDAHIVAALADDRIDYVIPFHKSSWKESLYEALGLEGYEDYTDTQHEKPLDGKRDKVADFQPSEYWDYSKTGKENAEEYFKRCKEDKRSPKFPQFAHLDGYWKLLIDFKMYDNDGIGSEQTEVMPEFNMDAATKILEEYEGGHQKLPVAQDIVDKFLEEYAINPVEDVQFSDRDSDYMNAVESGDMETAQKMVDEAAKYAGYNESGYHGTGADFNIFSEEKIGGRNVWGKGFYFGKSKGIADDYASFRERKGGKYRIVSAYLKMENPFVPYKSNLGTTEEILDRWFSDMWTNSRDLGIGYINGKLENSPIDLLQFIAEHNNVEVRDVLKEYGYDSIKDGGEYVVFDSNQIKSAEPVTYDNNSNVIPLSQRFNPENNDIRYSDRDDVDVYAVIGERNRLVKENKKLKADVERLKELNKLEKKVTGGKVLKDSSLLNAAAHLKKISESKIDKVELAKYLKDVYGYIANSENIAWDDVMRKCYEVSEKMLKETKPRRTETNDYAKRILKEIKGARISLNENQKTEAKHRLGSDWNRQFFGKVILAKDGISLDSKWQEWAQQYGEFFDADISDADQIVQLYETINALKEASEYVEEYDNEEEARWLANEIYNQYWNVSTVKTVADKYDKQIKLLRSEHRQTMTGLREEYNERLQEQKASEKQKYEKLVKEIKNKFEKDVEVAKQRGKEMLDKYKENVERKRVIDNTISTALSLNKKLKTNSKDVHIPQSLKPVVINLLDAIDMSSKQLLTKGVPTKADMEREASLEKARSMAGEKSSIYTLKKAITDALGLFENAEKLANMASDGLVDSSLVGLDIDEIENIKKLIKVLDVLQEQGVKELVLEKLNLEQLKSLNGIVRSINHWSIVADKSLNDSHKKRISVRAMQNISEMNELGVRQEHIEAIETFKNFFNWNNLLPVNAFKRLGDSAMGFFDDLLNSQSKCAFNTQAVMDFTDKLFKEYKFKNIKKWRTEEKTFELNLPGEEDATTVKMPVSYIMTLYCISKQEDAKRHLYGLDENGEKLTYKDENGRTHAGGGMTIKGYKTSKLSTKVNKNLENTIVNDAIVKKITSVLTDEQKAVADALQKFMGEKGAEWGNSVSMVLYGIKKFDIQNYFPITASPHTLNTDKVRDEKASLFSILNYGFTKERNPNARNSIEIADVFEVFANHMHMMAIYNAYALSIYDVARWLNYKGKTNKGKDISVTKSMEKAFGKGALNYVDNLLKDINGQHISNRLGFVGTIFRNTKVAMVGNSLSVTLLQPTAYIKAMIKINPARLASAAALPHLIKRGVDRAKKYSGLALLKSQGYFETGVSSSTTTKILHDESFMEKRREGSLWGAGVMDTITWGVLWNACEFEVRAKQKSLKVGSEEYFKAVTKKFDEVVLETQVIDSPLTKSDLMRSPDTKAKEITQFASELTVAYNIVHECVYQTVLDSKKVGKKQALVKNYKNLTKSLTAYVLISYVTAVVSTMISDFRFDDDDDEEELKKKIAKALSEGNFSEANKLKEELAGYSFESKVKNAFLQELVLIGKIPFLRDVVSLFQGYDTTRTETLPFVSLYKSIEYSKKVDEQIEKMNTAYTEEYKANAEKWAGIYDRLSKDEILKSISYATGYAFYNQWRDLRAALRFIGFMD